MAKEFTYLYGKNSVCERLKANPASIKRIFVQDNFSDDKVLAAINKSRIPTKRVSEKELMRIKCADRLQGIVAEADKYRYADFEELLYNSKDKSLTFLLIDGVNDPHNLGSIIRISACFCNFAVVIPSRNSCEVNDTVIHVASGGENYTPVSVVNNLLQALIKAKDAGFWACGAVVEGGEDVYKAKLPFPLCLVLGSEGEGIRQGITKHLDLKLTIPMKGAALSLNVAMACAIFLSEIAKRREG